VFVCPSSLLLAYSPGVSTGVSQRCARLLLAVWRACRPAALTQLPHDQPSHLYRPHSFVQVANSTTVQHDSSHGRGPVLTQLYISSVAVGTACQPPIRMAHAPTYPNTPSICLSVDCSLVIRHDACCGACSNLPAHNIAIVLRLRAFTFRSPRVTQS